MSCDMSKERLWVWVQGEEEDPDARGEIAAHVEVCPTCKSEIAEMRELIGDLHHFAEVPVTVSTGSRPDSIGDFRIIDRLGQGGMGVVYEAEQADPRRRVALKVILGGAHVSDLQVRFFQREAQTLARLNHPAIASIHAAGRTEDGNHYFAMELVRGVNLLDYAEGRRIEGSAAPLDIRQRLALFLKVCEGIGYAHQRGVIHRDIKPSNVLVVEGDAPQPKILDFGLARLMEDDPSMPTINTESGRLMGTLPYMSPEQALGERDNVDTRSDVYALGVVLYQLLTGSLPYDVTRMSLVSAVKMICEQRPASPRAVHRAIPDEAATIVMKALEKEPQRRYAGAAALGQDIERFLSGLPILARPASTMYQLRKLVARRKVPAALAALLVLTVLGGGIGMMIQARGIAEEARKSQRISAIFESMYEDADPERGGRSDATLLETLDDKARTLVDELSDDPLVAAAVRNTIGNTYRSLGAFGPANMHLMFAFQTRRELLGGDHADTAESMNDLGELRYMQGHHDEARKLWTAALAARRSSFGDLAEPVAETLNNLGNLKRRDAGELDEARNDLEQALRIRRALYAQVETDPGAASRQRKIARNNVAQTLNNLAGLLRTTGDPAILDEAERYYREALRMREESFGPDHPQVAKMQNNLGKLLQERGALDAAEELFQSALTILRSDSGYGAGHPYVGRLLLSLAEVKLSHGDLTAAKALAEESLQLRAKRLGENHAETLESRRLVEMIANGQARK